MRCNGRDVSRDEEWGDSRKYGRLEPARTLRHTEKIRVPNKKENYQKRDTCKTTWFRIWHYAKLMSDSLKKIQKMKRDEGDKRDTTHKLEWNKTETSLTDNSDTE
jgi:hypothetical protein